MAVDPEPLLPEDAVGRRVSCGGDRATVRYVGPVPPTKGVWLGVEWDNPERGKHDGVHEGVQYFTCSCPGSGSFVRPSKVSFGVDFLRSLIGRWDDVAAITVQLEALQGLELRLNRLQMPSDPPRLSKAFLHLTVLNLSECALSWTQVSLTHFLSGSQFSLDLTLKSLSLSQNPLDQLSILSLSSLPRLEQLNLSKTQLSSIQFSDAGPGNIRPQTTECPSQSPDLNLIENVSMCLPQWRVVNELSKLRSLVQLSCKRNHLKAPDGNHRTTSQLLIRYNSVM
uniref:Tubulin-specific chaperone E n=1 Tax=Periophthalmus magnuspinnatus TaxID=409849 RepID=A0A3B4AD82_9GOBI